MPSLKIFLDDLYSEYSRPERILHDPIEFPHRYSKPEDIEIAALISASFAYGRVDLFKPVIGRVLEYLGSNPHEALLQFDAVDAVIDLKGVYYRFSGNKDIIAYLSLLSQAIKRWGSLKNLFFHDSTLLVTEGSAIETLSTFTNNILSGDTTDVYGRSDKPQGLTHLLPDTSRGGTSKRMYMFLRWMVRKDEVDFGLWSNFGSKNLIIPMDTHVARIAFRLGLTDRKNANYTTAQEITKKLAEFDPDDPVKYDFALAHMGISGKCPAKPEPGECKICSASIFCRTIEGG